MADSSASKVAILGSGSFGTAMATVIARNGYQVVMHCRRPERAAFLNEKHRNQDYLTDFELPANLTATADIGEALSGVAFIVHCVPIQSSRDYLQYRTLDPKYCAHCEHFKDSLEMMKDLIPSVLGDKQPTAYISGPSFAKELMQRMPTGFIVASSDESVALSVKALFQSDYVRVYTTADIVGVEVGGALKNIFAIAAGVLDGMGLGLNSIAMLVTLGCKEMNTLAVAMGAERHTLSGLAGIGDLMLTCFGPLSRNRTVGVRLGRGESIQDILATMNEVAEGVATAPAAAQLAAKYGVAAPIINTVCEVLRGHLPAREGLARLMAIPTANREG